MGATNEFPIVKIVIADDNQELVRLGIVTTRKKKQHMNVTKLGTRHTKGKIPREQDSTKDN